MTRSSRVPAVAAPPKNRKVKTSAPVNPKSEVTQKNEVTQTTSSTTPGQPPEKGGPKRLTRGPVKQIALYGGLVLLGPLAVLAWQQPLRPRGDYPKPTFNGAPNWFFYPYEVNPWYRPPVPGYDIYSLAMVPGTCGKSLVPVGAWGKVLRTSDEGEHWTREWTQVGPNFVGIADYFAGESTLRSAVIARIPCIFA